MIRSPLMTVMTDAVAKAARSLKRDFGEVEQLQVSRKGPGDFVSAADRKAENILREALEKARPGYGFVMEESGIVEGTDRSPASSMIPSRTNGSSPSAARARSSTTAACASPTAPSSTRPWCSAASRISAAAITPASCANSRSP